MGPIERRRFLIAASALLAAPKTSWAQRSDRTYVVGALLGGVPVDRERYRAVLRERLATDGFIEGKNLRMEVPSLPIPTGLIDGAQATRMLLAQKVDALFACFTVVTQGALSTVGQA